MNKLLLLLLLSLSSSKNLRFLTPAEDIIRGGSSPEEKAQINGFENVKHLRDAIKTMSDHITSTINTLKTTKKDSLFRVMNGKGFSDLIVDSMLYITKDLPNNEARYKAFWQRKVLQLGIKNKEELANYLMDFSSKSKEYDIDSWHIFGMTFKQVRDDKIFNFCSGFVNKRESSGGFDIIVLKIIARVALSEDIEIWKSNRSVAGGVIHQDEFKIIRKPRTLSQEDVVTLFEIFHIVSVTLMTELLGLKIPNFPDLK